MLFGILQKAIPFLLLPILARYLSPTDFGIIAIYTTTITFLAPFIHLQMGSYIILNYYQKPLQFTNQLLSNILILSAGIAVLVTIISIPVTGWLSEKLTLPVSIILMIPVICFASNISNQNLMIQRNKEKPFVYSAYQIAQISLVLGLSLFLVITLKFDWLGRVIPIIVSAILFFFIHAFHLYRQGLLSIRFDSKLLRENLRFSVPLIPTVFGIAAINMADRYFIQFIEGERVLGFYSIGYTFGMIVSFVTTGFNLAFNPFIYKILTQDEQLEEHKFRLVQLSYLYFFFILIVALLATLASYLLIDWGFLPEIFAPSKKYIIWVAIGYVFWGMMNLIGVYISITKKTKYIFYTITTGVVVNTILNYVLIHRMGAIGAAYATAITFFITLIMYWLISAKIYPMPWLDKRILKVSVSDLKQLLRK